MIIIRTKEGDVFLNEKRYVSVYYNREEGIVKIYNGKTNGKIIPDVESVFYANDSQPCEFKSEGTELKKIKERLEHSNKLCDRYAKVLERIKDDFLHFCHQDILLPIEHERKELRIEKTITYMYNQAMDYKLKILHDDYSIFNL